MKKKTFMVKEIGEKKVFAFSARWAARGLEPHCAAATGPRVGRGAAGGAESVATATRERRGMESVPPTE